jgi:hypothetical protein
MTKTITHVYRDYASAELAVREAEAAGLPEGDISVVASNADGWHKPGGSDIDPKHDKDRDGRDDRAEGAAAGGGLGAVAGGAAGLAAGLGVLAIPGVGPIVALGWLATAAAGAVAGGATGGIIGALVESGESKENAALYAEALRRGGAIVTAKVPDDEVARYKAIMSKSAFDIASRETVYRDSGWTGYNPSAPAYDADQVRRERETFKA